LYRSLAKRDTAYNYAVIIGVLGAIVLENRYLVEVIFKKLYLNERFIVMNVNFAVI